MRKMLCSTAAFVLAATLSGPLNAAPAAHSSNVNGGGTSLVMPVAEGCGFGEHRGPGGRCVLNDSPAGVVRGIIGPGPAVRRVCPPGYHLGPAGAACQPNPVVVVPRRACPPGFHLGPAGERCLPN